mgnify:CR=1 FL=1
MNSKKEARKLSWNKRTKETAGRVKSRAGCRRKNKRGKETAERNVKSLIGCKRRTKRTQKAAIRKVKIEIGCKEELRCSNNTAKMDAERALGCKEEAKNTAERELKNDEGCKMKNIKRVLNYLKKYVNSTSGSAGTETAAGFRM